MYSLAGLFLRNDLGCASVIPSEQTASSYIILILKLLEIEKEIVREVVRGDKHNLRKSANRNAQISVIHSAHYTDLCFADFLRLCLSPRTTSRTISFSISNSF